MGIKVNKQNATIRGEIPKSTFNINNNIKCVHDLEYLGVAKSNCSTKHKCKLCGKIIFKRLW